MAALVKIRTVAMAAKSAELKFTPNKVAAYRSPAADIKEERRIWNVALPTKRAILFAGVTIVPGSVPCHLS